LRDTPTSFWGKLRVDAECHLTEWHPLEDHCADVSACCEALLRLTLIRRRLATLAGLEDLSTGQIERLCVLAALHDAGKVNVAFQRKADPKTRHVGGHVRPLFALFASYLPERDAVLAALGVDELLGWGPEGLLFAALAHHGQPIAADAHGSEADPALWKTSGNLDPIAGLRALAARARGWYPAAGGEQVPFPDAPAFQHAFSGLVTLADWLGSDTHFFPFTEEGGGDRIAFSRSRAREVLQAMGLDGSAARSQLALGSHWFQEHFGFPPRAAQKTVLGLEVPTEGSLVILESETGSGKTEAAFARFLTLFRAGAVDGLYFALPTRTAATQIHKRVCHAVQKRFPDSDARPPVVLAVPGYVKVDDVEATRGDSQLAPFHTLWPDDPADLTLWRRWAAEAPKRYLAGAVVVGTVDQVLLSALRVKHAHLRGTSLLRSLLVVDEVHASDAYMNRVLEAALDRHLAAGGHALLMSATLGAAARQRFLELGAGEVPSLVDAEVHPYPAVSVREGERRWVEEVPGDTRDKVVDIELAAEMGNPGAIASRAISAARAGARALVIRNTVADAIATQEKLEETGSSARSLLFSCGDGVLAPHHSRYSREDRALLDAELECRFGKGAQAACVVVATQTVQQSLDLDADLLITDLCPMDVLLQRIGRLHRHERDRRPSAFARARVVVLVPEEPELVGCVSRTGEPHGKHGIGRVYRDLRILQATRDLLEEERQLAIPARNRRYVERTTHPEALEAVVKRGSEKWATHRNWLSGTLMAEVGLAALNQSSWDEAFGARGWAHEDGRIATRLGAGDRVVAFDVPIVTPFGARTSTLTLPAWMAGAVAEEDRPTAVEPLPGGGAAFRFGERDYVYDRLGLRVARKPVRKTEEDDDDG
jgi:CRISPR-associated endonuclease/helicase Cas3